MTSPAAAGSRGPIAGRYVLEDEIAAGGMATIHLGRMTGAGGFARIVAIKRLHPHIAKEPDLRAMLLDEARIVSRIQHTHVVQTLDVVTSGEDVLLVMDYVHGEALHRLARAAAKRGQRIPPPLAVTIVAQALYGLHAAHEARDERGQLLEVVHRDVSPHNILVGADGVARVLDFGVAKARGRIQSTQDGTLKGKIAYMPAEQFRSAKVDRRTDIYAASVVLWELLVGRELYGGPNEAVIMARIMEGGAPPPSREVPGLPTSLDAIVLRGLSLDPAARFPTALEMAEALHRVGFATAGEIGAFVRDVAASSLEQRAAKIQAIERRPLEGGAPAGEGPAPSMGGPAPPVVVGPLLGGPTPFIQPPPIAPATSANTRDGAVPPDPSAPPGAFPMATAHTVRRVSQLPAPRSRLGAVVAMAVAGIGLAVLLGWILGRTGRTPDGAEADPARSADPVIAANAPSPATPPPGAPSQGGSVISPSASPAPSAAPVPVAGATASASSTTTTGGPAPAAPIGKPKKPRGAACTPPYTIDADGIRTPKPECL